MYNITLDELVNKYKEIISNFIKEAEDKIVVFDFDGTITEFKYSEDKMLPCKNTELNLFTKDNDLYKNVRILDTMKYIISKLNKNNVIILTQTVPNLVYHKNQIIKQELDIDISNIYHVSSPEEKLDMLNTIFNKYNKDIVFIEDNASILLKAEEEFSYVKSIHISSLLI